MSKPTIGEAVMGTLEAWNLFVPSGDTQEWESLQEAMKSLRAAAERMIDECKETA
jgi:hypothetical protein